MATTESSETLFAILPNVNVWNAEQPGSGEAFLHASSGRLRAGGREHGVTPVAAEPGVKLLDEVAPNETMLVSMGEPERIELLRRHPELRVVPVEALEPLWLRRVKLAASAAALAGPKQVLEVAVVNATTGKPLRDVEVVGLTDRKQRIGSMNRTGANGIAKLIYPSTTKLLESVEAVPTSGLWPAYETRVDMSSGSLTLSCTPIDLSFRDSRGRLGFHGSATDGHGVTVGVVDSGVSKHPDLAFKGINVVKGEKATDFEDLLGHGTHVAGIIAGRAQPGSGVRGVAPGVDLRAYRVFGKGQDRALSFNIAKGIRQAVDDGCDLINLSLGGEADVPDVLREILRARALGVLCIAAAGNDYRGPVNYPARYPPVLAVSAFGRKSTYPPKAAQELQAVSPFGKPDRTNYVAAFSNVGSQVGLIAPGVGIVSSVPGGYAAFDGTSMAAPVTTGAIARLLARQPALLASARNQSRSDRIFQLAVKASHCKVLGFGARFEGAGLLQ